MDTSKITKGISGYLRQEFRELEILNEITRLRYEGVSMPGLKGVNRKELIQTFSQWKGGHFDSADLHPVLRYKDGDELDIRSGTISGRWELVGSDKPKPQTKKVVDKAQGSDINGKRKGGDEN
jgi:hypothetical protein